MPSQNIELSIVMPCLNEAETIATCIQKAKSFLQQNNVEGEVIVADNGSTDNSQGIAQALGVRVIDVDQKGYGNALKGGIQNSKGRFIIMGDSDDSYDFYNLQPFLDKLRAGQDLVMGNRFQGGIKKGAMPFLHRYLGNPVLSFIGRLFFKIKVGDFHCGLRGFSKAAYDQMQLNTSGMEFASEMVVVASLKEMNIAEVPTTLSPDGRTRAPHLNTLSSFLIVSNLSVGLVNFSVQTLLYTALMIIIGFQFMAFYFLSIVYANAKGILPPKEQIKKIVQHFNLEKGLLIGGGMIVGGLVLFASAFLSWQAVDFGQLTPTEAFRITIPSCTLLVLGIQLIMYSFFWHIMKVPGKD